MICNKCDKEMKVINNTSQKYYDRVIYGCCGEIQVRNEEKPEIAQKYNLPSIDEVQKRRSEEIKRLNSILEQKKYLELSNIETGEQVAQPATNTDSNQSIANTQKKRFSCPGQSCEGCNFKCNEH